MLLFIGDTALEQEPEENCAAWKLRWSALLLSLSGVALCAGAIGLYGWVFEDRRRRGLRVGGYVVAGLIGLIGLLAAIAGFDSFRSACLSLTRETSRPHRVNIRDRALPGR